MKVYAGIGSRSTPSDVLSLMTSLAAALRERGWRLRSGNAEGADRAFQAGAQAQAEVFIPWPTFGPAIAEGAVCRMDIGHAALDLAEQFHPYWARCSSAARKLHARNCYQVLGSDLRSPARFVVCWTPDGSLDGTGPNTGGTGQALRIAAAHGVEVFNLARPVHRERIVRWLELTDPRNRHQVTYASDMED